MPERKIYDNITFFSAYSRLASIVQMGGSRNFIRGWGDGPGQSDKKL